MVGPQDGLISQNWWGIEEKWKKGTFEALEMGYTMRYIPSSNSPSSLIYSSVKYPSWKIDKIAKKQEIHIAFKFCNLAVIHIPEDLSNAFDTNRKPKRNAKNPPWMIRGQLSTQQKL